MTTQIALQQHALGRMIGMRSTAVPIRKSIELALEKEQDVVIDFTGVEVTQSFIDELIGALSHLPDAGSVAAVVKELAAAD